jgi:hypothetical protein
MSVAITHPAYVAALPTWQALRHAYEGGRAVKAAGTHYLPRPSGMKREEQYDAYKDRPAWRGATETMVHGTVGAIFRREPQVSVPAAMDAHLRNITSAGVPLRTLVETITQDVLLMGRYGLLIDFPAPRRRPDGSIEAPPPGSRPYWLPYITEDIPNWHALEQEGTEATDMIVLKEAVPLRQGPWPTDDYFVIKTQQRRRVLRLDEAGHYEVSVWVEVEGSTRQGNPTFLLTDAWVPQRFGEPLTFLPFIPMTPFSLGLDVVKSLLESLVEINYRHYRHSADYEHGLHLTSLPTPWVSADLEGTTELLIGSLAAWILPPGSNVGLLEYKGQGLQPHEHALETDIAEMGTFGTRILEGLPFVPETLGAALNRTQGTESPMQTLIRTVSEGITKALRIHAWWAGLTEDVDDAAITYAINTDLISQHLEPAMLQQLLTMLLSNTISYETFYYNLQRGEMTRPQVPVDEERALLDMRAADAPLVPPGLALARQSSNGT